MLRGMRARPATTTICAAAVFLGMSAATAVAGTGGAGMAQPAPKRTASAPVQPGPLLSPIASIPQLAAGVTFRRVSSRPSAPRR